MGALTQGSLGSNGHLTFYHCLTHVRGGVISRIDDFNFILVFLRKHPKSTTCTTTLHSPMWPHAAANGVVTGVPFRCPDKNR